MKLSKDNVKEMLKAMNLFNLKNKCAKTIVSDEYNRKLVSGFFKFVISETIRTTESLSSVTNTFNAKEVVMYTVDLVMKKLQSGASREHIHWAPTQSGKSAFKTVKILIYLAMNIPVIVLTKGKGESIELERKISGYLKGSRFESKILNVYGNEKHIHKSFMNDKHAFALIIPDTVQKIEIAHELLSCCMKHAKKKRRRCAGCALILDEVDAVTDRSEFKDEKNEKALENLRRNLKPYVVKVTATPIPVFANSLDKKPVLTTSNKSIENYVGVKNMRLHADLDQHTLSMGFGKEVKKFSPKFVCNDKKLCMKAALIPGTSKKADKQEGKRKFPNVWDKKGPSIPKFNSQCIKLLRRECSKKNTKGMLTLVDTCPWVDPSKNECVFHQASGTQDYFFKMGIKFIAIVVHADHVYYRLPGHSYSFECKHPVGDLIDKIDSSKEWGKKIPIVVFGYYAMKRSRSFRSSERVPSAMILNLGYGQSNENCRRDGARMTFKGLNVHLRNRKTDKVTILCPAVDFDIIQKYDPLVLEMIQLYNQGKLWNDIYWTLARTSKNFFLRTSKRKTGNYIPGQAKKGRKGSRASTRAVKCSTVGISNHTSDKPSDRRGFMLSDRLSDESSVEEEWKDVFALDTDKSLSKETPALDMGEESREIPTSSVDESSNTTPAPDMEESSLSEISTPGSDQLSNQKPLYLSILQKLTTQLKKRKGTPKQAETNFDEENPITKKRREIDYTRSLSSSSLSPSDDPLQGSAIADPVLSKEVINSKTEGSPNKGPEIVDLADGDDVFAFNLVDGDDEEDPICLT